MRANSIRAAITAAAALTAMLGAGHADALTYTMTTLVNFDGSDGEDNPAASVTVVGSTLYGTTTGESRGLGTVFSVPLAGGPVTTLVTFEGSNGGLPYAGLTVVGRTLYGTTSVSGMWGDGLGTVFSVPLAGGPVITLVNFNNGSNGGHPTAGLTVVGSTLYGTTAGTVFSVPLAGGPVTTLVNFIGSNGDGPISSLTVVGSTLYGTTTYGGSGSYGHVFSVPLTGGTLTELVPFNGSNGGDPSAGLTVVGSTLYGTTTYGRGTVFSVPLAGSPVTTLATFNAVSGPSSLTVVGSTLYGTTEYGGTNNDGTVFSVPLAGGPVTTLVNFNGSNCMYPQAGLTLSGNTLYGTTYQGGTSNYGTVFSLTPNPILSLTVSAPTAFGSNRGTLTFPNSGSVTFTTTPTGYLAVTGFSPSTETEIYALKITDSVPGNLAADLAEALSEINSASYSGYSVTASTTDPTENFCSGYNFYITITNPTLGTGSPYLGFDFTQLNGTSDTLSVSAVAAVPEPTSLSLLAIGGITLLARRRR